MKKLIRNTWLILGFMVIAFGLTAFIVQKRYSDKKEMYYDNTYRQLDIEIKDVVDEYDLFSQYVFDSMINQNEVLSLVYDAAMTDDEGVKDEKRDELYDLLEDQYNSLTTYNFRQVHFHLPDNTSFLRMHSPLDYGDDLSDVRATVVNTNENLVISKGFEEGRIFNGFRFVYPLFYLGQHIGSVEISVSMASIIEQLSQTHRHSDYYVLFDKTLVDSKVWPDYLDHYRLSFFSENFYFDQSILLNENQQNTIKQSDLENYMTTHANIFNDDIFKNQYSTISSNGKTYDVIAAPFKNFEGADVGYIIVVQDNITFNHLSSSHMFNMALIGVLFALSVLIVFLVARSRRKIIEFSEIDKLTQISNRHKFDMKLRDQMKQSSSRNEPFSLIMFDIDAFKQVNDTFGHLVGDQVLSKIAQIASSYIEKNDTLARFGGEEFMIILPNKTKEQAFEVAENIRKHVANEVFDHGEKLTISLGIVCYQSGILLLELLDQVDKALYEAKKAGKNHSYMIE